VPHSRARAGKRGNAELSRRISVRGPVRAHIRPAEYLAEFCKYLAMRRCRASREVKTSIESPPGSVFQIPGHLIGGISAAAASRWLANFLKAVGCTASPRSRGDCFLRGTCTTPPAHQDTRQVGQRAPRAVNSGRRARTSDSAEIIPAIAPKTLLLILYLLSWTRRPAQGCRGVPCFLGPARSKSASLPANPAPRLARASRKRATRVQHHLRANKERTNASPNAQVAK